METKRIKKKATKYLLANHNGVEIYLSIPSKEAKDQKYFIDYNTKGQKKYYGKGTIKSRSIEFFQDLATKKLKQAQIESLLAELFKQDIEIITHEIHSLPKRELISLRSSLVDSINAFYAYKHKQCLEGTIDKRALSNYGQYHRKLLYYFELSQFSKYTLNDFSSDFWLNYRIDLIHNNYLLNTKSLCNASVNQHFQYITQFYSWLIDYLELPIRNHVKKLKKLNESKQDKRFKIVSKPLLIEFYSILENKEKHHFTSLYLTALLMYENNVRLSEQVLIQIQDIDLPTRTISILNKKNDTIRTIVVSEKASELIVIIENNTKKRSGIINPENYLFGGYNAFKIGKPNTYKELGTLMRRFRKLYPQFEGRTLYEHKHTSITNQFDAGVDHYKIKERANHSSISTTEIYLQSIRKVHPYEINIPDNQDLD